MNNVMIVMLLWMGATNGGPATIQGFETMAACEAAAQIVIARQPSGMNRSWIKHVCMELPVR
jgi:hypothetical protein